MNKSSPASFSRRDRIVIVALLILLLATQGVAHRAITHAMTAHATAIHAIADASLYAGHAVLATAMTADPQNAQAIGWAAGAWLPTGQDLPALIASEKANMLTNTRYSAAAGELSVTYAIASTVLGLLSLALCSYLVLRVFLRKRPVHLDVEDTNE